MSRDGHEGRPVGRLVTEIARNIKSLEAGGGLLQQIDLAREY